MKIGIIDADLLGRKRHRFPNLVCEKISGYWKEKGAEVQLLLSYDQIPLFDKVYVSKVFTDTPVPEVLLLQENIEIGGTGFYFDKAPNLSYDIEHHMPDYHLYDQWIENEVDKAKERAILENKKFNESRYRVQFKEYSEYSIGFLTRGCFRKCEFCVNKKYDHVFIHSPLDEFFSPERKKICLLDDNVLGCPRWRSIFEQLSQLDKPFKFKQGLDERLLTEEKCEILFSSKYDGDFTFAFDNVSDYDLIHRKLTMIRRHTDNTRIKFYVLVGFESTDAKDIANAFKRIELLLSYRCLPYIMRYQNKNETPWKQSKYKQLYIALARWCNQPSIIKKMSFREFCVANQERVKTPGHICTSMQAMLDFEEEYPNIAAKYFDMKFGEVTVSNEV